MPAMAHQCHPEHVSRRVDGVMLCPHGSRRREACAALIPDRLTGAAVTSSNAALAYLLGEDPEPPWLDDEDRAILDALPQGLDAAARRAAELGDEWVRSLEIRPETINDGGIDPG